MEATPGGWHRGDRSGCQLFFFNDTATTEIYPLSLHDALPIWWSRQRGDQRAAPIRGVAPIVKRADRKSTRLNSSHLGISYAVFCLEKNVNFFHNIKGFQTSGVFTYAQTVQSCLVTSPPSYYIFSQILFFFFKDGAPPEISPLPPHGAFPI